MFVFHIDPGHGWLQVTREDMQAVGLAPHCFSRYSYRDSRGHFYLEEDCDASKFWEAYKAKHGKAPDITERHWNRNCPIRNMPHLDHTDDLH